MCSSGFIAVQAATQQSSDFDALLGLASAGGEPLVCVACESPCATCRNSPTTCLSCVSGRLLSGNNCLFSNKISVTATFAPTDNQYNFFNDQFGTIVSGMATAAGVAQKDIIINSVVYSSVILNA